jgi:predicted enzyme related to lactoylglutathione lyase
MTHKVSKKAEAQIDYVEIPVPELEKTREFLQSMFGWEFQDWGPDYSSFSDGRLEGGLRRSEKPAPAMGVLLVFYSTSLERDVDRVQAMGATISQPIFAFPGGRRFHFVDPAGIEFAMWSDRD